MTQARFGLVHKLCEACDHEDICDRKDTLREADRQIQEEVNCCLPSEQGFHRMKNCTWLCVSIQCKYFQGRKYERELDLEEGNRG